MNKNSSENIINLPPVRLERRISNTTYVISSGFNGDKSRDIVKSLARLMARDSLNRHDKAEKMM